MQRQPVIIALMQPNWFRVANAQKLRRAQELYADVDQWREVMKRSEIGKKCQRYMKELFDITIWRCANPTRPLSNQPEKDYDVNQVEDILKTYSPDIVIAFGSCAQNVIHEIWKRNKKIQIKLVETGDVDVVKPGIDFAMVNMCKAVRDLIEKL